MKNNWAALGVLTLGVLMIGIDGTVLSVASPSLSKELGASATDVLWIGDIFSFVLAGLLVTMGSLGDRIGHKKLLIGGATAFALLSVGAAYATTPGMLIGARALLGAAAATLTPATLALIRALFPEKRSRSVAVGVWAATYSAGTALGPVVGGLLLEHFWCGAAFLVNVPVGMAVIVGGTLLLPEMRNPTPGPWDLASAGLSLAAILGLVYAAKESVTQGLQPGVVFAGLLGASAAALFAHRQLTLAAPLIDLRLFRNRMFSSVTVANLLAVMGLSGVLFFLSQYFQLVNGYSPMQAGLAELPAALAAILFGVPAGLAVRYWSPPAVLAVGLAIIGVSLAGLTQVTTTTSYPPLAIALFAVGTGLGLVYTVANDMILSSVTPDRAGAAAGISETAFELGMALGIAVLGTIVTSVYRRLQVPVDVLEPHAAHARTSLMAAHQVAATLDPDRGGRLLAAAQHAFAAGLSYASAVGAVLLLASAATVWLMLGNYRESQQHPSLKNNL